MQFIYKVKKSYVASWLPLRKKNCRKFPDCIMMFILTLLLVISNNVALASGASKSFERGLDAFRSGQLNVAIVEWSAAAMKGNKDALFNLGLLYANGDGVKQDWMKAKKLFTEAGKSGSELAMFSLAIMYFNGEGVTKDLPMAHVWASLGADLKNETSRKLRDSIEKNMSDQELVFSEKIKQRCIDSSYIDC